MVFAKCLLLSVKVKIRLRLIELRLPVSCLFPLFRQVCRVLVTLLWPWFLLFFLFLVCYWSNLPLVCVFMFCLWLFWLVDVGLFSSVFSRCRALFKGFCLWVFNAHWVGVVCVSEEVRIMMVQAVCVLAQKGVCSSGMNGFLFSFSRSRLSVEGEGWVLSEIQEISDFREGRSGLDDSSTSNGSTLGPLEMDEGSGDLSLLDPPFFFCIL